MKIVFESRDYVVQDEDFGNFDLIDKIQDIGLNINSPVKINNTGEIEISNLTPEKIKRVLYLFKTSQNDWKSEKQIIQEEQDKEVLLRYLLNEKEHGPIYDEIMED